MEERKCPVCHKAFIVPDKGKWAYRKNSQLICSWTCLRAMELKKGEDKGMRTKVPEEAKQEAIRIALDGGNPITVLEPHTRNPKAMWWAIKAKLKEMDPETYARIPDLRTGRKQEEKKTAADAMAACQDAADEFFEKCQGMGLLKDQPKETTEKPRIYMPVVYDGLTCREFEGIFGRYRRLDIDGTTYIDFDAADKMGVMSYTVEQWRKLKIELDHAARCLGVEL